MDAKLIIILCCLLFSMAICSTMAKEYSFASKLDPKVLNLKKEKLTHFRLYWHDIVSGNDPTSITVLPPLNNASFFGMVNMIDNRLTVGPNPKSKLVGKSQGFFAGAAQDEVALSMAMNFAFTHGKYNGSSITILGRNPIRNAVREMPVIGGSGRFRFARGYAQARTYSLNSTSLDATVEYNVYVLHY